MLNIYGSAAFTQQFWEPYQRDAAPQAPVDTGTTAQGSTGLRYSADLHGPHAEFCLGAGFQQYKEEVRANLSFLSDFCRTHQAPDAEDIARNLQTFFRHRFDEAHYFDTRAELIDSIGKQSLDEFCSMIRHGSMDPNEKQAAIRDLAMGVMQCADGTVSHLAGAARRFAQTAGGLRGKLWELKEDIARNTLHRMTWQWFGGRPDYPGNQIHYGNTALNALASRFGFDKDPDGITMPEALLEGFLSSCATRLKSVLTPDHLALTIAERCLARFNSEMPAEGEPPGGAWTPARQERCREILRAIGNEFGLSADDRLDFEPDSKDWTLKESDLRLKSFLKLEEHDGQMRYALRADPALVALDVLRGMAGLDLLQPEIGPRFLTTWHEPNDDRAALVVYGALSWVARAPYPGPSSALWADKRAEVEPATVADLRRWDARRPRARSFPEPVVGQAIRATDIEELARMPAYYLPSPASIGLLVRRLGQEKALAYLVANAAQVGQDFTDRSRQRLLADLLQLGLGKAIPALVEAWSDSPGERVAIAYELLREHAMPALHRAMQKEDAGAAVRAWYEPLREAGLLAFVGPKLGALLNHRDLGSPAFPQALRQGHTPGVEAFLFVLKDILKDRSVQAHLQDVLPNLLSESATDDVAPALAFAMSRGYAPAVKAFYAGLTDLLKDSAYAGPIRPPLIAELAGLLVGKFGKSTSGLAYALANGHTEVVTAFHDTFRELLTVTTVGRWIRAELPNMLKTMHVDDRPALAVARDQNHAVAVAAWEFFLEDPAIQS